MFGMAFDRPRFSEAPIQLKSNCGVLVIDDFGRQRVTPTDILNRWIVALAQRFDILHQVCTYCNIRDVPLEITSQVIDAAVKNYFSLL